MTEDRKKDSRAEIEAEALYSGAKHQLFVLAGKMQLIISPSDVAELFLSAGLSILLAAYGPDTTRRYLDKALEKLDTLDDAPGKVH